MDQTWILTDLMMMETWKYVELKGIVHLICRVEGLFVHLMRHWSGIIPKHPALVNSMNTVLLVFDWLNREDAECSFEEKSFRAGEP